MKSILVYDWPTRLFHFVFSLLFIFIILITKLLDDDSPLYPYHMLMGLVMAFLVLLRILWGLIGSRYARFSSFILSPRELLNYFKGLFLFANKRYPGHNPASSWVGIVMMALSLGLAISGLLMSQKIYKEVIEEFHELFANLFLVTALAHIAGIIFHTLSKKDPIALSMINGKKNIENSEGLALKSSYKTVGVIFILLVGSFSFWLKSNYDSTSQTLTLSQKSFQLGKGENKESSQEFEAENDD